MDILFKQFKINKDVISSILYITDGYIAGSSVLYAYLTNIGLNPEWKPNDIDIWVKVKNNSTKSYVILFETLLKTQGYERVSKREEDYNKENEGDYSYKMDSSRFKEIKEVLTFINKENDKKIQVILHKYDTVIDNLKSFDLSICALAWNPEINIITIYENNLKNIELKKGFLQLENIDSRIKRRIEKYKLRGFKIYRVTTIEI